MAKETGEPNDECGPNEVYNSCPSLLSCQATCDQPAAEVCPSVCETYSCECKVGYVRTSTDDRTCIKQTECMYTYRIYILSIDFLFIQVQKTVLTNAVKMKNTIVLQVDVNHHAKNLIENLVHYFDIPKVVHVNKVSIVQQIVLQVHAFNVQ